ncbi:hypothetical protein OBV_25560 [Oscillibacter valericigenes Sjm18-20]|nr:hypothetical protein OBV_25560 [Oscillibacter valericigenes Sjm18-20]
MTASPTAKSIKFGPSSSFYLIFTFLKYQFSFYALSITRYGRILSKLQSPAIYSTGVSDGTA